MERSLLGIVRGALLFRATVYMSSIMPSSHATLTSLYLLPHHHPPSRRRQLHLSISTRTHPFPPLHIHPSPSPPQPPPTAPPHHSNNG